MVLYVRDNEVKLDDDIGEDIAVHLVVQHAVDVREEILIGCDADIKLDRLIPTRETRGVDDVSLANLSTRERDNEMSRQPYEARESLPVRPYGSPNKRHLSLRHPPLEALFPGIYVHGGDNSPSV